MTPESVATEAADLHRLAGRGGATLRLLGSLAIGIRCPVHRHLLSELGRRPPRDIDFMGYSREERAIESLLRGRGYRLHPSVSHSREWGVKRLIYTHEDTENKVDVFLDQLVMAHTIDFAGRLELDTVTVTLADLLLSKLQIYRITENDLIDLVVLLAEADFGAGPDQIDLDRIRSVLADDWGFSHGATLNLTKVVDRMDGSSSFAAGAAGRVRARARALIAEIDTAPKTARWRVRARFGTRIPWYEHVDDVDV